MKSGVNLGTGVSALGLCATLVMATPAHAQSSTVGPNDMVQTPVGQTPAADQGVAESSASPEATANPLGDIVVTAERRSSSVQRTGLAITALDAATLTRSGAIVDARDLAVAVPAVHIASLGPYTNVYIHGVGGGVSNPYGSPAVAYSIDGVFIDNASAPGTAFYDLSRVEVVKGPQGTLYGRNATAGALNLVPNKPSNKFEAAFNAQYGNYNDLEFDAMVNVPLSDTVRTRIAARSVSHNGYITNGTNDADTKAVRAQIAWDATPNLQIQLYGDYTQSGGNGPGAVPLYPGANSGAFGQGAIAPSLPADQRFLDPGNKWTATDSSTLYPSLVLSPYPALIPLNGDDARLRNKQYVTHLQGDLDLGFGKLTVIPAFVAIRNDSIFYQAGFRAAATEQVDQYSLEARLASNSSGPFKWIVGGYFFHTNGSARNDFFQEGQGDITLLIDSYHSTSKAAFAQATYSVTPAIRLTGGIRYTHENKSETGQTIVGNLFLFPPATADTCQAPFTFAPAQNGGQTEPARCGVPNVGNLGFSSVDYKGAVEIDLGPRSLFYANVSSGFKAGGFNPGTPPNTYGPERLRDYDIGIKNRFFGNRLQLNAEGFYWTYRDQQAQAFGPINPQGYAYIVYPSKSHIYGASVDAVLSITPNDRLGATVEYQVGKYDRYQTAAIPLLGVAAVNGDGETRPFTPTWTERVDYTHTVDLAGGGRLDLNANTLFQSRQYVSTTPKIAEQYASQSAFHKTNASLTYTSEGGRYTVGAYVTNIENTFTINSVQLSTTTGNYFAYVDAPRTYGVRVGAKF